MEREREREREGERERERGAFCWKHTQTRTLQKPFSSCDAYTPSSMGTNFIKSYRFVISP